jgi:hypothetical protein
LPLDSLTLLATLFVVGYRYYATMYRWPRMNISPAKFEALTREIDLLKTQVTSLFTMLAEKSKPRDPSIDGFCKRKGISRSTYVNLRRSGEAPRETPAGTRRLIITEEDEAAWDRERQALAPELTEQRKAVAALGLRRRTLEKMLVAK